MENSCACAEKQTRLSAKQFASKHFFRSEDVLLLCGSGCEFIAKSLYVIKLNSKELIRLV